MITLVSISHERKVGLQGGPVEGGAGPCLKRRSAEPVGASDF